NLDPHDSLGDDHALPTAERTWKEPHATDAATLVARLDSRQTDGYFHPPHGLVRCQDEFEGQSFGPLRLGDPNAREVPKNALDQRVEGRPNRKRFSQERHWRQAP